MGLTYALQVVRQTLINLSSDQSLENRLSDAYSEITVLHQSDLKEEQWKELAEWKKRYLDKAMPSIENPKELKNLSIELVCLCTNIIEINSKSKN